MSTSYNNLPLQGLVFKASHNSYQRDETIQEQLTFHESAPYQCGCRGIELDIQRNSSDTMNPEFFTVNHTRVSNGDPLKSWLDKVLDWNDGTDHDVVWIMLDIKSSSGDVISFPDELDQYLTQYFGLEYIATPASMFPELNTHANLSDIVAQKGWPILDTLKGKYIFCLSGTEDWKRTYANQNPAQRLCFSDATDDQKLYPSRAVYNVQAGDQDPQILNALKSKNVFIRIYDTNSEKDWQNAKNAGANMLATDQVSGHDWAEVSKDAPFAPRS